jgi:hypothetical protein
MEFLADMGGMAQLGEFIVGIMGVALGVALVILGILGVALLAFTVWMVILCLKSHHTTVVKFAWVCAMVFFFPFGSVLYVLYFLAYSLFGRNGQGGVGANSEDRNYLVKCRQCGEGILWNIECCTQCGEPRPSG